MKTELKKYIKETRGVTIAQAARDIGCSRQRLSDIAHGVPAGKRLAVDIQDWSGGKIRAIDLMQLK